MIVTFQQIKNKIYHSMGFDPDNVDDKTNTEIELRINQIQDDIFFDRNWEWRKRRFYFTTKPPYETGTITVTQGSRTVTGSGTTWTDSMKTGYLSVASKVYKIDKIVSTTSLKLKGAYTDTTGSGKSYGIVYPDYILNPYITGLIAMTADHSEVHLMTESGLTYIASDEGQPSQAAIIGRTEEDYYNTGSVSVTNGSTTVTGGGFISDMEGRSFRVNEFADMYVIRDVVSATEITLDRAYQGDTGSGKGYKIDPAGSLILQLRCIPDDYYFMEISALIAPLRLVSANDISLIPNQAALLHGSVWAFRDYEDRNPVAIQQAAADYNRTLKQLQDSYGVVSGVQWISECQKNYRQQGGDYYNPLAD